MSYVSTLSNAPSLKAFQEKAVAKISSEVSEALVDESTANSRKVVLDSPTGSGKTRMIAEVIQTSLSEALTIVLSPGAGNLEQQTHDALSFFLSGSESVNVRDMTVPLFQNPAAPGTVVVKNWESLTTRNKKTGEYSVYLTKDGDSNNLFDWLTATANTGVPVIIVIDEAHYGNGKDANAIQSFLKDVNDAVVAGDGLLPVILEASATPIVNENDRARSTYIVDRKDVISEGLMRKRGVLNDGIEALIDALPDPVSVSAENILLTGALDKSNELNAEYRKIGSKQHALIAVQIPNSTPGKEAQERTIAFFADKGLTIENGQVAVFTSQTKTGVIDDISSPDSPIRVLIYKQGIATGWDCPRAQILVGFRHINSLIFSTQNIGRFSRSTEARHYTLDESPSADKLNDFYVYSNISDMGIGFHPGSVKGGNDTEFAEPLPGDKSVIDAFNAYHLPFSTWIKTGQSGMDERKVGKLFLDALRAENYDLKEVTTRGILLHSGFLPTDEILDDIPDEKFDALKKAVGEATHELNARWNELLTQTVSQHGDVARQGALVRLFSQRLVSFYTARLRADGAPQDELRRSVVVTRLMDSSNYPAIEKVLIKVLGDDALAVLSASYENDPEGAFAVDTRVFKFGGSFNLPDGIAIAKKEEARVKTALQNKFLYREEKDNAVSAWRQETALSNPEVFFEQKMLGFVNGSSQDWELEAIHKNAPFANGSNFSLALSILDKDEVSGKEISTTFFPDYLVFMRNVDTDQVIPMIVEIKDKNPGSRDKHVGAKARAAKAYYENTGVPFVVLSQNATDSDQFWVYGSENAMDWDAYLESVKNTSVKTFQQYGFGVELPAELVWMRTLGR